MAVLANGAGVWHLWRTWPVTSAIAPVVVFAGIAGLVATWVVRSPRNIVLQLCAFVAVMLSALFPEGIVIHKKVFYTTDSAAFNQVSARLLLHGHDPYVWSLASAARLLSIPARFWTYTANGGHVVRSSYPAGSFLLDMPAMLLGFKHMVVDWTDLIAWTATAVLFFALLPASLRWLAGLLAASPVFVGALSSGGTDAAVVPFLILAVWRWDRFARPDAGISRFIGPMALGLACTITQTPWFFVPILAIGVALEARRNGRRALRPVIAYLAVVAGAFLVINLPFIIWEPHAWLRGALLPFFDHLVANGQGIVILATQGLSGGVNLTLMSYASGLCYLAIVAAWIVWYPQLKRVWVLLLPLVFFVAPRSLASYMVDLIPVAVVAAVGVSNAPSGAEADNSAVPRRAGFVLVPLVAAMAILTAVALTVHPLRITVDAVKTSVGHGLVKTVTITVENLTGSSVQPRFLVNAGSGMAGYWQVEGSSGLTLPPHHAATVTLVAPSPTTVPHLGSRWLVGAYTSPDVLTTSPLQIWHGQR